MPFSLIFVLLLFIGLFIWLELRALIKQREYKELMVASLFLVLSISYGLDYALDRQFLPNPNKLLYILKPVSESVDKFFQITG